MTQFASQPPFASPNSATFPAAAEEERVWALFLHLSHLTFLFLGIPVAAPLILWLIKKDQSVYLNDQGKEAVNFSISLVIWSVIGVVAAIVVAPMTCGIGLVLGAVPWLLGLIGTLMGTMASTKGEYFRYPMCWRFLH